MRLKAEPKQRRRDMSKPSPHDSLFSLLEEYNFENPIILCRDIPILYRLDVDNIREKFKVLESFGFKKENIAYIFSNVPYLFKVKHFYLDQNLNFLFNVYGIKEARNQILESPSILIFDPQKVSERITLFQKYKFSDPMKLLTNYPWLLYLKLPALEHKINYFSMFGFKNHIKVLETNPRLFEIQNLLFAEYLHRLKATRPKDYIQYFERNPRIIDFDLSYPNEGE